MYTFGFFIIRRTLFAGLGEGWKHWTVNLSVRSLSHSLLNFKNVETFIKFTKLYFQSSVRSMPVYSTVGRWERMAFLYLDCFIGRIQGFVYKYSRYACGYRYYYHT